MTARVACTTAALACCLATSAAAGDTIRVWKVGSPHETTTPARAVPSRFVQRAAEQHLRVEVEAFPAKGFAATFFDAVTRNAAPDLIVFDNYGVMDGMTTQHGTFQGIGEDPAVRQHLIQVTGAFDELLGPRRGWTFLFDLSSNYEAAKRLALDTPGCPSGPSGPMSEPKGELAQIVATVAAAYLESDTVTLQRYADPDRLLPEPSSAEATHVLAARPCGMWATSRLAVALASASYESGKKIGHSEVLIVLRNASGGWRLLVAARDPISTGTFFPEFVANGRLVGTTGQTRALPLPAKLVAPPNGDAPKPSRGQRFGNFTWRSSASDDVVAEIAEFAYKDDARLFFMPPAQPDSRGVISAGRLWTTRSDWTWRIWSITRAGDVTFSDTRTFPH